MPQFRPLLLPLDLMSKAAEKSSHVLPVEAFKKVVFFKRRSSHLLKQERQPFSQCSAKPMSTTSRCSEPLSSSSRASSSRKETSLKASS